MLPTANTLLNVNIEVEDEATRTYHLDIDRNISYGMTDDQAAMKQAVYLILQTERYKYLIFSRNYGVELEALFGRPVSWCISESRCRIREALLQDTRITDVTDFDFTVGKNQLLVTFTVKTIYGNLQAQKEVIIGV
jgi:hypothetical protein